MTQTINKSLRNSQTAVQNIVIAGSAGFALGVSVYGFLANYWATRKTSVLKTNESFVENSSKKDENKQNHSKEKPKDLSDSFEQDLLRRNLNRKYRYDYFGAEEIEFGNQDYENYLMLLNEHYDKAISQMKQGNLNYALYEIRLIIEVALRLLVSYQKGVDEVDTKMFNNLKICEATQLLDYGLINRLHTTRKICNMNGHEMSLVKEPCIEDVEFAANQARELMESAQYAFLGAY